MSRLKYYLRVLSGTSFKKLGTAINKSHEKSGKNKVFIFFDMLACAMFYGAGYNDYLIFAFWDMKRFQRKTYLTRLVNKRLVTTVNDSRFRYIFDKKDEFNKRFGEYLHREYIYLPDAGYEKFCEFFKRMGRVIIKPRVGESGKGIELLHFEDNRDSLKELYDRLMSNNLTVIEEVVVQHPKMAELYPDGVNTLRVVTFVHEGKAELVYAVCKMGNGGRFVDNMESGGLCCPIDISTGKICGIAHSSALINYEKHPQTGVELIGFEIPFVNEAIELCLKAAMEIPEFRYLGWDAAITQDGPLLFEGNDYPGYDFWQLPEHTPDKIGLRPYFAERVPGI